MQQGQAQAVDDMHPTSVTERARLAQQRPADVWHARAEQADTPYFGRDADQEVEEMEEHLPPEQFENFLDRDERVQVPPNPDNYADYLRYFQHPPQRDARELQQDLDEQRNENLALMQRIRDLEAAQFVLRP